MLINFKNWLESEEESSPSNILLPPSNIITLGSKRDPKVSGFCLHNPQINKFAQENSTQMFMVLAFVLYTIQKEWQIVRQTFPDFLKWVFEEAIPKDNWDYRGQSFSKYAHILGMHKIHSPNEAAHMRKLWEQKNTIYSTVMSLLSGKVSTSLTDSSEFEIFKYLMQNVSGLGPVKAAFASQLIIGKFGCIYSVNTRAYFDMIKKDIKKKDKKSGFKLVDRKDKDGKLIRVKGKKVQDIEAKDSLIGLKGYVEFLDSLQELYGDDISKILWDDWCQIVGEKVVKAGSDHDITLKVNNQEFTINPYVPKSNLRTLLNKEKEHLGLVDPTAIGTGVSLGHLSAITQSGDWRTPQIKAMENFDSNGVVNLIERIKEEIILAIQES
jgi:hypothetical protein